MVKDTNFKITVIGDAGVGKTCLLIKFSQNEFPTDYVPTVFDNYTSTLVSHGKTFYLELWDTAGQDEYDTLRPLGYPGTSVFLVTFSTVDRDSIERVTAKWMPELAQHVPEKPSVVLVGTKIDLRESSKKAGKRVIEKQEGIALAKQIGAKSYVETSAKSGVGVGDVFLEAIAAYVGSDDPNEGKVAHNKCNVL